MNAGSQFKTDVERLAKLINRHTGISCKRLQNFIIKYGASELFSAASRLAKNDVQRERLAYLFEFKNLYEIVKAASEKKEHFLQGVKESMTYFTSLYADKNDKERLTATFLNSRNRIIATKTMTTGTINKTAGYPRDIVKEALFYDAVSVIIAHNHPGNSKAPSPEDIALTKRLEQSLKIVGINLLDHIIVTKDGAESLCESGHLNNSKINGLLQMDKIASLSREKSGQNSDNLKETSFRHLLTAAKKKLACEHSAIPSRTKTRSNLMEL